MIDEEVLSIINKCYDDAMNLLIENREVLDKISDYLYEHETITGKEFMKIFRELKGIPEPEEEKEKKTFFEQAQEAKTELRKDPPLKNAGDVTEDMFEEEAPKGNFIDQTIDDNTGHNGE